MSESNKKNRCAVCRKKLGMVGFECKCSRVVGVEASFFCAVHRQPEDHACSFDHGATQRELLKQSLGVSVSMSKHDEPSENLGSFSEAQIKLKNRI